MFALRLLSAPLRGFQIRFGLTYEDEITLYSHTVWNTLPAFASLWGSTLSFIVASNVLTVLRGFMAVLTWHFFTIRGIGSESFNKGKCQHVFALLLMFCLHCLIVLWTNAIVIVDIRILSMLSWFDILPTVCLLPQSHFFCICLTTHRQRPSPGIVGHVSPHDYNHHLAADGMMKAAFSNVTLDYNHLCDEHIRG